MAWFFRWRHSQSKTVGDLKRFWGVLFRSSFPFPGLVPPLYAEMNISNQKAKG
jgi:hypothetical protein